MIRRQARFLGKPVRARAAPITGAIRGKAQKGGGFLKQLHE
jgi:hypothetical protein